MIPDDLIGTTAAAHILGVDPHTIVRWTRDGRLRGWWIGGRVRVSEAELRRLRRPVEVRPRYRTSEEDRRAAEAAMARMRKAGLISCPSAPA